jgi:hypothetical protein
MQNLKRLLPLFFSILVVCVFFWRVFIFKEVPLPGDFIVGVYYPWLDYKWGYPTGVPVKNPITADIPSFIYPMQTYAIDILKSGKMPLWNPLILTGTPLLANFQSAPFSPLNFVYFLMDKLSAWTFQIILQHFFALVFTYILLRRWKVSKLGSILGGIIFAFSGFSLIWSEWNGHTLSSAFIPLILFFEDRWFSKSKLRDGIGLSIILCFQILSGYPQVVLYTIVAAFLLTVVRFLHNPKKIFIIKVFILGIFAIFGLGLSAFQILPGVELLKYSQRAIENHPFDWAFLPWTKTITFIASDFYGNHATKNYWGPQDYTSNIGYVGIVAFMLSLIALALIKKREVLYSFILAILALLLSFPTFISIFLWKSGLLGLNAAAAHRALVLFNLAFALLAGFGFDSLLQKKIKNKYKILSFFVTFILITGFFLYAYLIRGKIVFGQSVFSIASRNLILPIVVFVITTFVFFVKPKLRLILLFLCIGELFYFGWKFTPFSPRRIIFPTTPVIDFLTSQKKPYRTTGDKVIPMNMRMAYGLETPEGYDAIYTVTIAKLLSAINDNSAYTKFSGRYGYVDREDARLLDLMNVKYFLAIKEKGELPQIYKDKKFMTVFEDKSVVVLENKDAMPRAFMVYDWVASNNEEDTLSKLLSSSYLLDKKIILEDSVPVKQDINKKIPNSSVKYLEYGSQESQLQIETDTDGMLFVSDSYFPGWHAYIDGIEGKIYKADFAFRAIKVPKGEHEVDMIYRPDSFYNGLKFSLASFIILVIIGVSLSIWLRKRY